MLVGLVSIALAAQPIAGLEWSPLSRSDLTFAEEDRDSGLLVGEFDGVVNPSLKAFYGAWWGTAGLVGTLGVARVTTTSWTGVDTPEGNPVFRQRHHGVLRPGLDLRLRWRDPESPGPQPWAMIGAYGDIPSVRDTSNGYGEEETASADAGAALDRARLGGIGGRTGLGVDLALTEDLSIGAVYAVRLHRNLALSTDTRAISTWVSADAALLLTFRW